MLELGMALAALHAITLALIGVGALSAPAFASRQYGIAAEDASARALVRAIGARDLALGIVLGGALIARAAGMVVIALLATALVAAVDFVVVARRGEPHARRALWLHGGGFVLLLVAAALAHLGPRS